MAGHSKWANIKHRKAAVDAKRGKLFTQMAKMIMVAVKEANGDVESASVIAAIEKAKKANVPKENIERAIKKASDKDAASLETVVYEGYGPAGVGLLVVAMTDNRNRTGQEVKHAFSKLGFSMGTPGSVSWAFSQNENREWVPNDGTEMEVSEDDGEKLMNLVETLEDLDDVAEVITNAA